MPKNSTLTFKAPKESDISIGKKKKKSKDKQRTKKWRKQRNGNYNSSELKALFTCSRGKSRLDWDNLDKVFSFGDTAIKYIYSLAKKRETGRYIEGAETYPMKYGTIVEPLIAKASKKLLKKNGYKGKLKETGYKTLKEISTVGASSDRLYFEKKKKKYKKKASVEFKACTNWETHFERTQEAMNEKSGDFVQTMLQLAVHKVDKCFYIVAEPPQSIRKYIEYPGDIMELYDDFVKECKLSLHIVEPSPLQLNALIKRIMISEDVIHDYLTLDEKPPIVKILGDVIQNYQDDPTKFEKYPEFTVKPQK